MLAKLFGALFGAAVLSFASNASAESPPIFVGGQFIRQHALGDERGHLLVPVRGVFEAFGATVTYTPPRIVVVRKNEAIIAGLVIGRRTAIVANRRRNLDVAPIRYGGRVYVPLRSIAEIAGASVQYSTHPRLVDIRVPNNDLSARLPTRVMPEIPPDPTLPAWAYALVGVFVLGFLVEFGRRIAAVRVPKAPRTLGRPSALPSGARALQLPYSAGARDEHAIGKMRE